MNTTINTMIQFIASYVAVIGIGYFLLNFLTNGFITTFLRVKASRGSKQLLIIHETTTTRYKVGHIEDGFLIYKGEDKKKRRIPVKRQYCHRVMGLDAFELDNEGRFSLPDLSVVQGHDHVQTENLFIRSLTAPKTESLNFRVIIILIVVAILIMLFVGYICYQNYDLLQKLGTITTGTI